MAVNPRVQKVAALIALFILASAQLSFSLIDVHDLLPMYDIPKGLLPSEIKSYSLSTEDNSFTIELRSNPCYIKFGDQLVYYDKIVKGKLGFGKVSDVSGIQAKKFFLWVSVSGMDVDDKDGTIEFHVGALSDKLPRKDFEAVQSCKAKGVRGLAAASAMDALV